MDTQEIEKLVSGIEGWLTTDEGALLYDCARNCQGEGVIVEIGSWKGRSSTWLGKGSQAGKRVKVYAVDPHTGSPEHHQAFGEVDTFGDFKRHIDQAGVTDVVVPVRLQSAEAAKSFGQPVEFIFIDGAHEYEMVKLDYDSWFPKVVDGGVIAFHDTLVWDGPKRLVRELIYKSDRFRNVRIVGSITVAQKVTRNSRGDRIRNRYTLLLHALHAIGWHVREWPLPKPIKRTGKLLLSRLQH